METHTGEMDLESPNFVINNTHSFKFLSQHNFWNSVKNNCVISGSFVAHHEMGGSIPNDLDLFCNSTQNYNYISNYLKSMSCQVKFDSPFATTFLTRKSPLSNIHHTIQVIKPFAERAKFDTEQSLISNFDLTVCQIALVNNKIISNQYDYPTQIICHKDFGNDYINRNLVITTVNCPIGTLKRILKYKDKGFNIRAREFIKLYYAWDNYTNSRKAEIKDIFNNLADNKPIPDNVIDLLYI